MKKNIKIKKDLMKIYYSQPPDIDTKAVESTLRVQREWHREKLENVISKLNFEGKKILDLACGSGGITRYLKKTVPSANIYAVDFNVNAISYAKKKDRAIKGLKYFVGDAQKIPFRSNFFDVVISITAIQNFQDIEEGLREIKRVGKNKFVLSFLKKSTKKDLIDGLIRKLFKVEQILEEDKDLIYFCE